MKKFFKSIAPICLAVLALSACNKEQNVPASPEKINITVKAVPEAFANPETRTYIDETQTIIWGKGEYMTIGILAGETTAFATSSDESADVWDGESEAYFEFSLTPGETAETYKYVGMYPASAAVNYNANPAYNNNDDATAFKVSLPSTQNATATSYDPAAYIMIAKPEPFDAIQTEWTASYRRATALNKVTLTNIPEDIVSVEFTAPEEVYMAGRRYIDLTTGESGNLYGETRTETIEVKASLSGTSKVVWFTSWGVEIPVGETFKIVAKSATKSYTRTLTVANKSITFKEGFLNTLKVNMASAEVADLENYEGTYIIGGKPEKGKWALMSSSNSGSYYEAIATDVETNPQTIVSSEFGDVNDYLWTVSKVDGGYAFKSIKTGKYIDLTSNENKAFVSDNPVAFSLTISEDKVATIKSNDYSTRVLRYNSSQPRFAFYTGTQNPIYLIPATLDEREKVATPTFNPAAGEVEANSTISISCVTEGATIYYTTDGSTPTTSSSSGSSVTISEATTINAIAVKEGYRDSDVATANYTIIGAAPKGTAENPYTVAEARAAIDAGEGTTDVYVKGIISKIVTAYSSQYNNTSFNISENGSTSGNQLQAYRAVASSAEDFLVGDGVLMHGNLKKYSGTYELDAACTAEALVRMPSISPADNTTFETSLEVSITAANGATARYTTDGSTPTLESSIYSSPLTLTETTTVKAISVNGVINSAVVSASYTKIVPTFSASLASGVATTSIEVDASTTSATIYVSGNVAWEATASAGVTLPANPSGTGVGTFEVSFAANTSETETKEHTVTVTTTADVPQKVFTLTIIQNKKSTSGGTVLLSNQNIVDAGAGKTGYNEWELTDEAGNTWSAYAIKNSHSNATSQYHYLQIRKYQSNTAYYIQIPEIGTKITKIEMTVSGSNQTMTGGGNSATLFFSSDNSTSAVGDGVTSGTGASSVTINTSSLNLNSGYITASGAVRIWDVKVTYE